MRLPFYPVMAGGGYPPPDKCDHGVPLIYECRECDEEAMFDRSWVLDEHQYASTCANCLKLFTGHRGRLLCTKCSKAETAYCKHGMPKDMPCNLCFEEGVRSRQSAYESFIIVVAIIALITIFAIIYNTIEAIK